MGCNQSKICCACHDNQLVDNDGKVRRMNDKQKYNLLTSYINFPKLLYNIIFMLKQKPARARDD